MVETVMLSMRNESTMRLSTVSISAEELNRGNKKSNEHTFGKAIHDTTERLPEIIIRILAIELEVQHALLTVESKKFIGAWRIRVMAL